jgi:hypothetical protein
MLLPRWALSDVHTVLTYKNIKRKWIFHALQFEWECVCVRVKFYRYSVVHINFYPVCFLVAYIRDLSSSLHCLLIWYSHWLYGVFDFILFDSFLLFERKQGSHLHWNWLMPIILSVRITTKKSRNKKNNNVNDVKTTTGEKPDH